MSMSTTVDLLSEMVDAWLDKPYSYKGDSTMNIMLPDPEMAAIKYGESSPQHRFEIWSLACHRTGHVVCKHEYHRCTELARQYAYPNEVV